MTRLLSLAALGAIVALGFVAGSVPALAAESGHFAIAPAPIVQDVAAPDVGASTCILAIVEDQESCTLTVAALDGRCPRELVPMIESAGARLLGSDAFLRSCAGAASPARPPVPD